MATSNKRDNTGLPYELLVQGIFQAIHDQTEVSNIIVEHNKTLKGKSITHQIGRTIGSSSKAGFRTK